MNYLIYQTPSLAINWHISFISYLGLGPYAGLGGEGLGGLGGPYWGFGAPYEEVGGPYEEVGAP